VSDAAAAGAGVTVARAAPQVSSKRVKPLLFGLVSLTCAEVATTAAVHAAATTAAATARAAAAVVAVVVTVSIPLPIVLVPAPSVGHQVQPV